MLSTFPLGTSQGVSNTRGTEIKPSFDFLIDPFMNNRVVTTVIGMNCSGLPGHFTCAEYTSCHIPMISNCELFTNLKLVIELQGHSKG